MTYKGVIFFDIDGTLTNSQGQVPLENKKAIEQLKINGYLPIICTGRGRGEMGTVMIDSGISSAILLNGMELFHQDQLLFEGAIKQAVIEKLLETAQKYGHELGFYCKGQMYISAENPVVMKNFHYFHQQLPRVQATIFKEAPCQMLLVFSQDTDLDKDYQQSVPELTFVRNSPYSMDVTPINYDKASGILHIQSLLKATHLPSYAFGDGLNDLTMFATVDTPIAMGNRKDQVKEAAKFITLSNNQAGIPYALQYFGLI